MKLLIATGIYPPTVGGPATYAKLLFDELPKRGMQVEVVSFDSVRSLPVGVRHMVYFCKLLLAGFGKDCIYTLDPVSVGYPAMWVSKITRKPLVLKMVGDYAWEQGTQRFGVHELLDAFVENKKPHHPRVRKMQRMQTAVAQHATRVVVPSQYLKKIITHWGIEPGKIQVIYNAFESSIDQVPSQAEARALLDVNVPTIVTAGRLVPWKGIGTLIEIMPALLLKFPKLRLVVAGSGPEREDLERLVQEGKLSNHVVLRGALSQSDLFTQIRASDVFVLNTGYEGFSHQLLEVLAIGTPVVTTDVGGNPELITSGQQGLLVPYNDRKKLEQAIEKMLTDDALVGRVTTAGKETVRQFTKDRLLDETIALLTSIR
jgi:glycosyltransferase involved in cell wall biosynthesis